MMLAATTEKSFTLWDLRPVEFLEGLAILVVAIVLARVLRSLVRRAMQRARVDQQVTLFARWLGSPAYVFGSFGILALAFSLAFQDILKNFIAGVFLLLERPFKIGDEITVDGHTGTVDNVEIRTTTLRTEDGEEVLIPNSLVYTETIVNRSRYPTRMFTLTAKLASGEPVDGVVERVRSRLEALQASATAPTT